MTTRKRNEWLDSPEEDEENNDNLSEAQEERKGVSSIKANGKRRRLDNFFASILNSEGEVIHGERSALDRASSTSDNLADDDSEGTTAMVDYASTSPPSAKTPSTTSTSRPLVATKLSAEKLATQKTGVIYLSRIPPFMKPATVKHLLSPYGNINRIFLTPEEQAVYTRRVQAGGNKKRSFVDGWIEFTEKKDAKAVAQILNAQLIGGKKGGWYHDDVWNIKYLRGFKWHHLTEQIANENAERAARMRAEISRTTRENKKFVESVERSKMLRRMEEKRLKQPVRESENHDERSSDFHEVKHSSRKQRFRQSEVKMTNGKAVETERVFSQIF